MYDFSGCSHISGLLLGEIFSSPPLPSFSQKPLSPFAPPTVWQTLLVMILRGYCLGPFSQLHNWKGSIGIMAKSYGWASAKESIGQEACSKSNGSSSEGAPKVVPTKGPSSTPSATTPTSASASTTTMMATTKRPERHRAPLDPCQDVRECFDLQSVGGLCILVKLVNWSHDWRRRVDLKAEEPLQCQVKTSVEKYDWPRLERASSFFEGHKVTTED